MHILIIEPYFTGSHESWAKGYQEYSQNEIEILSMEGRYWKWRMHGGAVTLAGKFNAGNYQPDLILATDMLDLTTFLALTRKKTSSIPTALYFHENQLTYPWSEKDRDIQAGRDNHYGFINYASALAADCVFFNSVYHMESFTGALPNFLKGFPDYNELDTIEQIVDKSQVLSLGLNLSGFDDFNAARGGKGAPVILWNHRWEYDKNPKEFFEALYILKKEGLDFQLVVLGENFSRQPDEFEEARNLLSDRIIHFGFVDGFEEYAQWLHKASILPVTSNQDFFGGSVVQAMYCGVVPLLPDRLAYPQHVPNGLKDDLMYNSSAELVVKLKALITSNHIDRGALKDHVAKYDWSIMAAEYDQAFASLSPAK